MSNLLAFSTLGCPAWDLDRILTAATDYGYDALELRGYLNEMDLPKAEPFARENRAETARRIADAGLTVCCVSSSGVVAKANLDHVKEHVELAGALGCPFVRVFGGQLPGDLPHDEAVTRAAETLGAFGDAAQGEGTAIVLETHDSFSTGASVAELLAATNHPAVFALWDLHHPYRQNEPIGETYRHLAPALKYVHVKDGKDGTYTLLGEGDVPTFPMLDLLLKNADPYGGPISVEWEKRWKPDIADPEVALPQYAKALRAYLSAL